MSTVIVEADRPLHHNGPRNDAAHTDEIKQYMNCRFVSASEAIWRIFGFFIHEHHPSVEWLSFHLPGEKSILYEDHDDLRDVVRAHEESMTKFQAWMHCNSVDDFARTLTYIQFPEHFVWNRQIKQWTRRRRGRSIGRIYFVHPTAGERFYLRMLLNVIKGPRSYEEIRTVHGVPYATYREACSALGLLDGDGEWHQCLREAAQWASGPQLRQLFVIFLLFCKVDDPLALWQCNIDTLTKDILFRQQRLLNNPQLTMVDEEK